MTMLGALFSALSPAGIRGSLQILVFHRVLPTPDPLLPGEMDARQFDDICGWVSRWFNVLPLDAAVRRLGTGELPARALAITFDDGYRDNHDVALPILRKHRVCATFFVATGFLDGGAMWNDRLADAVRHSRGEALDVRDLGLGIDEPLSLSTTADRAAAIRRLLEAAKYLDFDARLERTRALERRAGSPVQERLMMTPAEVRALHAAGMQIGAHSVEHPILARVSAERARSEVVGSKATLESLLDAPVTLFAYPNGVPGRDFGDREAAIVAASGFDAAVTTAWGAASAHHDPYRLPRFTPWDRGRLAFAARLAANYRYRAARAVPAAP